MAQQPPKRISGPAPSQLAGIGGDGAVTLNPGDPAAPILLEFESPTAALLTLPVPFRSRFTIWLVASMFLAMLVVAFTLPIDRVVNGAGKVVSVEPNVVVQPLEISIVRSINAKEGELVHKGDLLAQLDPTFASSDAVAEQRQETVLQAQVDRLQAEMDGRTYLSDGTASGQLQEMMWMQRHNQVTSQLEQYNQQIASLRAKVDQAKSDVRNYTDRLALAKRVEAMRKELERLSVGSQLNTLAAIDQRVEVGRQLEDAVSAQAGAERDLDAQVATRDAYLQQFRSETGEELAQQQRALEDMRGSAEKSRLRRKLVELRADRDAIVLTVAPVSVGSVMQPGDQFFTLVPTNSPLELETIIDGKDAGFVSIGDPVTIKFDTFPYFTYGIARGVLRVVGPDSFSNPMQSLNSITTAGQSSQSMNLPPALQNAAGNFFYRAKISIDQMLLHDLPPGFHLIPGMPVTTDIKVGTRTVVQYLLSRVIPATTTGMHEP